MKTVKTVNLPNEFELELQKYQTAQMEKGKKKPQIKEIVETALREFLERNK